MRVGQTAAGYEGGTGLFLGLLAESRLDLPWLVPAKVVATTFVVIHCRTQGNASPTWQWQGWLAAAMGQERKGTAAVGDGANPGLALGKLGYIPSSQWLH